MKLGWLAVVASGCVLDLTDVPGNSDRPISLWVDPSQVDVGSRALVTITDDLGNDLGETMDLRTMGDFSIVEWQAHDAAIDLVIDVDDGASGEQLLAVELPSQTVYATFDVR